MSRSVLSGYEATIKAKPSAFRPDKMQPASLLNSFKIILQKACVLGVWTKVQILRGRY